MKIKKEYAVGDQAWIHGVGKEKKLVKGTVVKSFSIDNLGSSDITYYVVSVATHIEPLLEIRTWETISQDQRGPVGGFRDIEDLDPIDKLIRQTGYSNDKDDDEDPSVEQIQAAIDKSLNSQFHQPLIIKDSKPKPRRRFNRRRPKE